MAVFFPSYSLHVSLISHQHFSDSSSSRVDDKNLEILGPHLDGGCPPSRADDQQAAWNFTFQSWEIFRSGKTIN